MKHLIYDGYFYQYKRVGQSKWKHLLILLLIVLALLFILFPKRVKSPERIVIDVRSDYIESQYPSWAFDRLDIGGNIPVPIPCPTPVPDN